MVEKASANKPPVATVSDRRRASWSDESHRPHHMRWRQKVAYLEHEKPKSGETTPERSGNSEEGAPVTVQVTSRAGSTTKACAGKPHHMRWRDKIAYLEHQADHGHKTEGRRASESDAGEAELHVQASGGSKTKVKAYTESFTHHPQHIRFRDKMAILRGEKSPSFNQHNTAAVK